MKVTGSAVNTNLDPRWGRISGDIQSQRDLVDLIGNKDNEHKAWIDREAQARANEDKRLSQSISTTASLVNTKISEFSAKISAIDASSKDLVKAEQDKREVADSQLLAEVKGETATREREIAEIKSVVSDLSNRQTSTEQSLSQETQDRISGIDSLQQYVNQQTSDLSSQVISMRGDVTEALDKTTTHDRLINDLSTYKLNKDALEAGENIKIEQDGDSLRISAVGEISIDYEDVAHKPSLNGKTIVGSMTSSDFGLQDKLESGVSIKTINNQSLLGEGNIEIKGGTGSVQTVNNVQPIDGNITLTGADIPLVASTEDLDKKQNKLSVGSRLSLSNDTLEVDVRDLEDANEVQTAQIRSLTTDVTLLEEAVSVIPTLQKKLVAGDNITITPNGDTYIIESVDTTYSAGSGITITNNVISTNDASLTAGKGIIITDNVISAPNAITDIKFGDTEVSISKTDTKNVALINIDNLQKKLKPIPGGGINLDADGNISAAASTTYLEGKGVEFELTTNGVKINAPGAANAITRIDVDGATIPTSSGVANIQLKSRFDAKQDLLEAGTNIAITGKVVSADVPIKQVNYNGVKVNPVNSIVNIEANDKQDLLVDGTATKIDSNKVNVQYDDTLELVDGKLSTALKDIQQEGESIINDGVVNLPSFITSNGGKFNQGSSIFAEYDDISGTHSETIFNLDEFTTLNVGTASHMTNIIGAPVILKTMSDKRPILNTSDNYILSRNDLDSDTVYWDSASQKVKSKASGGVISSNNSVADIVKCTQAEYDALITPDPKTLYIIVG